MARQKEEKSGKSKFEEALERLNKTYGEGSVLTLESKILGDYDVISAFHTFTSIVMVWMSCSMLS